MPFGLQGSASVLMRVMNSDDSTSPRCVLLMPRPPWRGKTTWPSQSSRPSSPTSSGGRPLASPRTGASSWS
jgi:hypothetical protein